MSKTYSTTIEITEEKEYSVTINTGLNLSAWIAAGSTTDHPLNPSSYANFAALEADEKAIRQLMLVHNAVDYLATAEAGDSLMQSVINSNVCAKWINISDYAYDKLSANANIKSVMDTADKYGYGEWGKINSTTWGPLGNVPIMTANNAPYGTVIRSSALRTNTEAWMAFSQVYGNTWLPVQNQSHDYIGYIFVNPLCVKRVHIKWQPTQNTSFNFVLQGSNDTTNGSDGTWTDIKTIPYDKAVSVIDTDIDNASLYFKAYRLYSSASIYTSSYGVNIYEVQFYGRELKPLVPTMTADDKPKGQANAKSVYNDSASYKAYKAFDGDDSTYWLSSNGETDGTAYVEYRFGKKVKPMIYKVKAGLTGGTASQNSIKIESSDDNFTSDITDLAGTLTFALETTKIGTISGASAKKDFRVRTLASNYVNGCSAVHTFQIFGSDYSEKEFATGSTRKTIYDHGIKPSGIHLIAGSTGGTPVDDGNQITVTSPNSAALSNYSLIQSNEAVNMGNYDYMHVRYGNRFVYDSANRFHLGAWKTKMTGQNYANSDIDLDIDLMTTIPLTALEGILDITQISATEYPAYYASYTRAAVTASIKELWLE